MNRSMYILFLGLTIFAPAQAKIQVPQTSMQTLTLSCPPFQMGDYSCESEGKRINGRLSSGEVAGIPSIVVEIEGLGPVSLVCASESSTEDTCRPEDRASVMADLQCFQKYGRDYLTETVEFKNTNNSLTARVRLEIKENPKDSNAPQTSPVAHSAFESLHKMTLVTRKTFNLEVSAKKTGKGANFDLNRKAVCTLK